jgi:hypothetical protein
MRSGRLGRLMSRTNQRAEWTAHRCTGCSPPLPPWFADRDKLSGMAGRPTPRVKPAVCFPWEERLKDLPEITGSPELVRRIWEDIDGFGNTYIWQLLRSF